MNLSLLKSALFILVLSIFWTGCEKDPITDVISNSPTFDIDQFEENIIDALDGNATGFAYTIAQNGQLYTNGAGGWAVVGGSVPGIPQSPDKRMTIASISKPITAVAALRVMEEHNVQLSEPFVNYLPSTWTVDASLNDVSLEQLLTHTSGIVNGGSTYEKLRDIVADGVLEEDKGDYDYNNTNFAMFRIILPYIMVPDQVANVEASDSSLDALTTLHFIDYIRWQLFDPIGIEDALLRPDENNPTFCYNFDDTSNPWLTSDYSFSAGAFGWYLSTNELANFYAHTLYDDNYLSPAQRTKMMDKELGLKTVNGDHGTYIGHGGDWYSGGSSGRGMTGAILHFPNDVEVSLLINCRAGEHDSKYTLLRKAYDNAWE